MTNMLVGFVHSIKWAVIDYDTRLVVVHRAQRRHHGLPREARLGTDRRRSAGGTPFRMNRSCSPLSLTTRAPTGAQTGLSNSNQDIRRPQNVHTTAAAR
jgi:hypothetical protein